MPNVKKKDLPGTIERSPAKAQRTFPKTLESAHEEYDSEERAHRTAYWSLNHIFEKVVDQWEPKDENGPSDERANLCASKFGVVLAASSAMPSAPETSSSWTP